MCYTRKTRFRSSHVTGWTICSTGGSSGTILTQWTGATARRGCLSARRSIRTGRAIVVVGSLTGARTIFASNARSTRGLTGKGTVVLTCGAVLTPAAGILTGRARNALTIGGNARRAVDTVKSGSSSSSYVASWALVAGRIPPRVARTSTGRIQLKASVRHGTNVQADIVVVGDVVKITTFVKPTIGTGPAGSTGVEWCWNTRSSEATGVDCWRLSQQEKQREKPGHCVFAVLIAAAVLLSV